jgi:hypothetical protein
VIWTTWRQHRVAATVALAILAALAGALIDVGLTARDRARGLGLPGCFAANGDCANALDALHRDFHQIPPVTGALVTVPLLAGMFWAAPLVSSEYEAGTHRLAWTQSVSPLRWITVKIALIFGFAAMFALVLGALTTWTLDPLTDAFGGRYNSSWFDIQGVVPVACMVFALAAGVAASALVRRTVPAMAVTLVAYAAARIPIHWVRANFAPMSTRSVTVPVTRLLGAPGGPQLQGITAPKLPSGAWTQGTTVIDAAGHAVPTNNGDLGIVTHFCPGAVLQPNGDLTIPASCHTTLQTATVHETVRYQPASHFWLIQSVESVIFLAAAGLLVTVAILAVTRRRST